MNRGTKLVLRDLCEVLNIIGIFHILATRVIKKVILENILNNIKA